MGRPYVIGQYVSSNNALCDHLDGILYPLRIRDLRNFGFTAELFPGEEVPDE